MAVGLAKKSPRTLTLLLVGGLVLSLPAAGAMPPARELAQEILRDPAYQKELEKRPEPRSHKPESGCDQSGGDRIRFSGSPAASAGGASVVSLLAWLAVGVAAALVAVWVGAAVVRHRRDAQADSDDQIDASDAQPGRDPSLAAVERLAAQGQFTQATHELLLLAVKRLAERHGRTVSGWLTSRELIRLLPATENERHRFSRLVAWVERSLFGGQAVDRSAFDACLADFQALGLG